MEERRREKVRFILHCVPPLLPTIKEAAYSSSSTILQVGCLLHREDEEYATYSIARRRGREEEYTTYSSSPLLLLVIEYLAMEEAAYS